MRCIKLIVAYYGTRYAGWQIQPNAPTIQAELESSITAVTGERVPVIGSGRTDSGVHAFGQVAAFRTTSTMDANSLHRALNAHLGQDIASYQSKK